MKRTVIAVIMAAVVMIAAVIPVGAEEASFQLNLALQYGQGRFTDLFSTGVTIAGSDQLYIVLYGDIQPNMTYNISVICNASDLEAADKLDKTPYTQGDSYITKNAIVSSYNTLPDGLLQIPSSNIESSSYALYATARYVNFFITINTNDLAFESGNNYVYCGFNSGYTSSSITISSFVLHAVKDETQSVFNEINNNITNITSAIENITENQTNIDNSIQEIVTNTQQIENITTTISNQVSNVITEMKSTNSKLDQTNTILNQIQYYGSDYDVPQGGADLTASQEKLSGAEKAVSDKSTALKDSVSSQWSGNKTTAMNFISTITPATAAVTTVLADITAVMPAELQAALVAIPMILFIGWLIGRLD